MIVPSEQNAVISVPNVTPKQKKKHNLMINSREQNAIL